MPPATALMARLVWLQGSRFWPHREGLACGRKLQYARLSWLEAYRSQLSLTTHLKLPPPWTFPSQVPPASNDKNGLFTLAII